MRGTVMTSEPVVAALMTIPSIALALGGGGVRGLAHVLVLEVFDEMRLRPKVIAGTSIGAWVGAAYALGLPASRIRAMFEETLSNRFDLMRQLFAARSDPVQKVLRLLPLRSSLLDPESVLERLVPEFDNRTFADLKIPLKVVATDLVSREAVVLEQGSLRRAVGASIAIPILFTPVSDGSRLLVDGGLVNPLPYDLVMGEADITVAIDISGASKEARYPGRPTALDMMIHSLQIMEKSITREKLKSLKPDIYVDVDLDGFNALEVWRSKEILKAAQPVKDQLRRQLEQMIAAHKPDALPAPSGARSPKS